MMDYDLWENTVLELHLSEATERFVTTSGLLQVVVRTMDDQLHVLVIIIIMI